MGEVIAFPERREFRTPAEPPAARRFAEPRPLVANARRERPTRKPRQGTRPEPLWREVTGGVLREERRRQQRTLGDVALRAGMSIQYLSELERGRKEASSEMLAAACGALGLDLAEFAQRCAHTITSISSRPSGPVLLAA